MDTLGQCKSQQLLFILYINKLLSFWNVHMVRILYRFMLLLFIIVFFSFQQEELEEKTQNQICSMSGCMLAKQSEGKE